MNKKFSTLVASLLLTSAFSVYSVDAKPMLATPTQVETRAVSADVEETQLVSALPDVANLQYNIAKGTILPGFTNNARLYVMEDATTYGTAEEQYVRYNSGVTNVDEYLRTSPATINSYYWTFINGQLINNANQVMSIQGRDHFEIIPVETTAGAGSRFFVLGTRDSNGQLFYVTFDASASTDLKFRAGSETNINNAAIFCSVETYFEAVTAQTAAELNAELGNGFNLSISSLIDEDAAISGAEVFAGVLTAMKDNSTVGDATTTYNYMLRNADGNFIVFEKGGVSPSDQNAQKGTFKLVSKNDVASYVDTKGYNRFNIYAADNGSKDVIVKMMHETPAGTPTSANYRLYIASTNSTFALSVEDEDYTGPIDAINYAVTSMVADNYVNLKQFLTGQFVNVDFVGAPVIDGTNRYKVGGTLVTKGGTDYDFVAKSSVYEKAPEAQWAVAYDKTTGYITLVNRENPETETNAISALRSTTTPNVYEVVTANGALAAGDLIKITFVEDHSKYDGYARFDATDLRNKTYHLGQVRQAEGEDINVYWAENHGTHQIGATVEEANASKWNLSFVNKAIKDHESEVDSVLIVSNLTTWNPVKGRPEEKADTLVILPYAFQNRSNNEFVRMNDETNLLYYICDKDNKDNGVDIVYQADGETEDYRWRPAQRFALKMKADGTYNYIALASKNIATDDNPEYSDKGGVKLDSEGRSEEILDKVYQENSTDRGTWRDMGAYEVDANALMFVTEVKAPEYRKLVTEAALDTIKLYRADNEAQVVYEKRNDDAIVNGKALSFLNIDNDQQFTEINPALYADTAYVNRGNNTRWQYLLGVNISHKEGYYCPEHGFGETEPCQHAEWVSYNEGRYLINMIDTANVYGANVNIHNNPYINETEEGNVCAKLSFVDAIHVLTDNVDPTKADKLYVINGAESRDKYTVIDLSTADFNVAKFAFKYTDSMTSDEFKIQTLYMPYTPEAYATGAAADPLKNTTENGYLRWVNGCIVVDDAYQKGDVFNMDENETRTPTANEAIEDATSAVSVIATEGGVIVKGAEGKNVIVSTILGKVVANEVINSDNETIAAPAGIVVVSVDGESFKVAVK